MNRSRSHAIVHDQNGSDDDEVYRHLITMDHGERSLRRFLATEVPVVAETSI